MNNNDGGHRRKAHGKGAAKTKKAPKEPKAAIHAREVNDRTIAKYMKDLREDKPRHYMLGVVKAGVDAEHPGRWDFGGTQFSVDILENGIGLTKARLRGIFRMPAGAAKHRDEIATGVSEGDFVLVEPVESRSTGTEIMAIIPEHLVKRIRDLLRLRGAATRRRSASASASASASSTRRRSSSSRKRKTMYHPVGSNKRVVYQWGKPKARRNTRRRRV